MPQQKPITNSQTHPSPYLQTPALQRPGANHEIHAPKHWHGFTSYCDWSVNPIAGLYSSLLVFPLPNQCSLPQQLLFHSLEREYGKSYANHWHDEHARGALVNCNRETDLNLSKLYLLNTDGPDWSGIPGMGIVLVFLCGVLCIWCVHVFGVYDLWMYGCVGMFSMCACMQYVHMCPLCAVWYCILCCLDDLMIHRVRHWCSVSAWISPF